MAGFGFSWLIPLSRGSDNPALYVMPLAGSGLADGGSWQVRGAFQLVLVCCCTRRLACTPVAPVTERPR
uniref:Uncharacterized protein n=1 Tax=mine drainage metagenome TaxID=410659 RepID=E6QNP3_9ZZZZ